MDFQIEKLETLQFIGFEKEISFDQPYKDIPLFWDQFIDQHLKTLREQGVAKSDIDQAIIDHMIGEFAVIRYDHNELGTFSYMIAGLFKGGIVPKGLKLITLNESKWAKFKAIGKLPDALQTLNTNVFQTWLPNQQTYEMSMPVNLEWYMLGDGQSEEYESGIWIPIKEK
ncbi:MAG: GyrI-like domain-containing protein [Acholeplasmataceae bacterium]